MRTAAAFQLSITPCESVGDNRAIGWIDNGCQSLKEMLIGESVG
jgi:hypothetical protein